METLYCRWTGIIKLCTSMLFFASFELQGKKLLIRLFDFEFASLQVILC